MISTLLLATLAFAEPPMPGDVEVESLRATVNDLRAVIRTSGNQRLNGEANRHLRALERDLERLDALRFDLLGHAALIEGDLAACRLESPDLPPPRYLRYDPSAWASPDDAPEAKDPPAPSTPEELERIKTAVASATFSNAKLDALRSAIRDRHFQAQQVREILDWFSYGRDKVEAAVMLHPRVIDHENWFVIYEAFNFPTERKKVQERIGDL
ncbi:MAG: DUF4476 domain-containing protein [Deltaproteobacteria bacterium]|nr:MAG: DUF4476 domain-containing protein [Deltaproteobacteria bacterium]